MTEQKMTRSLNTVAQKLDDAGIMWVVFAGSAATAYGATRPLTDVDILVPAAEGARAAALFPEAQVKHRQDGTIEWIKLPDFDILAGLTVMDLDNQMAARITHHEIAAVTVPVIPPEDNILLKASWGRGPEVGKHDWEDVEAMMAYLPSIDWEYLRRRAETCVSQDRKEQMLKRLEILWNQLHNT